MTKTGSPERRALLWNRLKGSVLNTQNTILLIIICMEILNIQFHVLFSQDLSTCDKILETSEFMEFLKPENKECFKI